MEKLLKKKLAELKALNSKKKALVSIEDALHKQLWRTVDELTKLRKQIKKLRARGNNQ